ncbi:unnamed protein product [Protopolystoma xenopodis]|uniref:Uncharacterized protein n=1 Tax=Protopolystoma xenopodis TaxID=117903 RepID=A0A3S5B4E3_9PLAT|nr:unnamed protein product [Protopolystoma xenopodis]
METATTRPRTRIRSRTQATRFGWVLPICWVCVEDTYCRMENMLTTGSASPTAAGVGDSEICTRPNGRAALSRRHTDTNRPHLRMLASLDLELHVHHTF